MSLPASKLQRAIAEPAWNFQLGDYISRGFNFMNQNAGLLIVFMLVTAVLNFIVQLLPFIGFLAAIVLAPIFQVGYGNFVYTKLKTGQAEFSDFFKGFNKVGPLVITYLITVGIALLSILPGALICLQAGLGDWLAEMMEKYPFIMDMPPLGDSVNMGLFILGGLVMAAGAIAIAILFAWAVNIAWFFDVPPMEAVKASRNLIARNWGMFVAFIIVAGLIAGAGAILCFVGLLYTAPAMACAQFFAFADATNLLEDDEDGPDNTIDHFVA